MTVLTGMAVQALGGADRAALVAVAELATRALALSEPEPSAPKKRGRGPFRAGAKRVDPSPVNQLDMEF